MTGPARGGSANEVGSTCPGRGGEAGDAVALAIIALNDPRLASTIDACGSGAVP